MVYSLEYSAWDTLAVGPGLVLFMRLRKHFAYREWVGRDAPRSDLNWVVQRGCPPPARYDNGTILLVVYS